MKIRIGHVKRDEGEYIGRAAPGRDGSPLANPYHINSTSSREQVIAWYKRWLWLQMKASDQAVVDELLRLLLLAYREEGLTLVCWCRCVGQVSPACHGDVIKAALEYLDSLMQDQVVKDARELGAQLFGFG